jgi:hypothetical protein
MVDAQVRTSPKYWRRRSIKGKHRALESVMAAALGTPRFWRSADSSRERTIRQGLFGIAARLTAISSCKEQQRHLEAQLPRPVQAA